MTAAPKRLGSGPWPSADAVAAVIVAVCAETGDDPMSVPNPAILGVGARPYVLHSLAIVWDRSVPELSRLCGYATPRTSGQLEAIRRGKGWDWGMAGQMDEVAIEARHRDEARHAA